jgi:hypothetical protein
MNCDQVTEDFYASENSSIFRIGIIFVVIIQLLAVGYIAYSIQKFINHSQITVFTISIVSLVGIALLIGLFENISIIVALSQNNFHSFAWTFTFSNCWLGMLTLQDIHNVLTYTAALVIACKYHQVAKQIDSVLQ